MDLCKKFAYLKKQPQLVKLNVANYSHWAVDIKILLYEKIAWDIVNGTEKKPDEKMADPI